MGKIHVLPETVQNKIAAGEVVERPASVVKELAENAMDAGANQVTVELEEGGHRLIRVTDNGFGMDEEDLIASMQRHATSKIDDVDDIFRIATFGFRGEALPSIGSVSRMSIVTCADGREEGHELLVEGGRSLRLSPAPKRKGTQIEVRELFFNTPARRKFQRNPAAEGTRANEALTRLALGNPGVGFRLQTNGRITMSVKPAASQLERIRDLFGREIADKMVPFENEVTDGLAISGFFVKPPKSLHNTTNIYVLVNKRWIRYYALAKAVGDAFQGTLPPRGYPFAVVNLSVDPSRVDVNVHPAKEEVRFEQERLLLSGTHRAIREALALLATTPTVQTLSSPELPVPSRERQSGGEIGGSQQQSVPEPQTRRLDLPVSLTPPDSRDFATFDLSAVRERLRPERREELPAPPREAQAADATKRDPADQTVSSPSSVPLGPASQHRILGQAGGKYIIVDSPDGLLLVDPHALHERWNFDRLVEERKRGAGSTRLLLPLELHLSPAESATAVEAVPSLAEYGFDFEMPDPNRMRVLAAPSFIPPAGLEHLLRQILADLGDAGVTLDAARERLLASLACRSSVLLGKSLPDEEIVSLLDRFFRIGQLPTCPHGRPTAIKIDWGELARRFGR